MRRLLTIGIPLTFFIAPAIALLAVAPHVLAPGDDMPSTPPTEAGLVNVSVFDDEGDLVAVAMPRVVKTDEEWQAILSDEQFRILRNKGTEPAFCGTLLDNKMQGVYTCAGCALPLFSSDAKFTSGTGWPSFFQPIATGNVIEKRDISHGMIRTEILCGRCDGHLGHVFEDGPRPTGLRFCLNSESLTFTESTDLESIAEVRRAVFAGGCFWCVEAVFEELKGVYSVESGYTGGEGTPDYKSVCTGTTGHAEAVRITYDPDIIAYEDLLRVHFATHDPTTLNRQGADRGTQYRSAIFFKGDEDKAIATAMIEALNEKVFDDRIVTTLEPLGTFHAAEPYHQNYVCENPTNGYVRNIALPKVDKVRKQFKDLLKDESPLGDR
ncbi:MAG: bifunctional methionine sulfoxide reductase B/A protein [Phycisphaerales bacterium]|nr:bifunctional methionine sulfoxide reductase B/A protein [Phycisphaerales bacterium]